MKLEQEEERGYLPVFYMGNKSVWLKIEIRILKYPNYSEANLLMMFHVNFS